MDDSKQCQIISQNEFDEITKSSIILNNDLVEFVTNDQNILMPIPLGSALTFLNFEIYG